jgi:hypothetical protein
MLIVKLFYKLVELFVGRSDLVREQIGTFLQVATDVTHVTPSLCPFTWRQTANANGGSSHVAPPENCETM